MKHDRELLLLFLLLLNTSNVLLSPNKMSSSLLCGCTRACREKIRLQPHPPHHVMQCSHCQLVGIQAQYDGLPHDQGHTHQLDMGTAMVMIVVEPTRQTHTHTHTHTCLLVHMYAASVSLIWYSLRTLATPLLLHSGHTRSLDITV